ncbi:MAG TPA: TadE family protein [Methylophilaceae bacterium]|nr:TadE family protein [Methylophilaceae bacterium]
MVRRQQVRPISRQAGAAAIEFALLFTLFYAIFYALVSYAITMMLQQSFTHAAAEGARAAIAVNPLAYPDTTSFNAAVATRVRSTVDDALAWLPQKAKTAVTGNNVGIAWDGNILTVQVRYAGYAADPMLPALNLPMIGDVPKLPAVLAGSASITL